MRELERAEAAQRLRMLEEERRRREYEQRQREQAAAAARAQKPDTAEKDPGNDLPLSGEEMAAMINDEGFLKYFYSVVDAQSIEERLRLLKARMEENGWHDAGLEKSIREHKFIALLVERAQRRKERGEQK
ncbi:MAG: hypothetical protein OXU42_07625 [Deltaproteobacteria bacterium]|nr:hypothetical protein [Deltaproteobacteria bacterium]